MRAFFASQIPDDNGADVRNADAFSPRDSSAG